SVLLVALLGVSSGVVRLDAPPPYDVTVRQELCVRGLVLPPVPPQRHAPVVEERDVARSRAAVVGSDEIAGGLRPARAAGRPRREVARKAAYVVRPVLPPREHAEGGAAVRPETEFRAECAGTRPAVAQGHPVAVAGDGRESQLPVAAAAGHVVDHPALEPRVEGRLP